MSLRKKSLTSAWLAILLVSAAPASAALNAQQILKKSDEVRNRLRTSSLFFRICWALSAADAGAALTNRMASHAEVRLFFRNDMNSSFLFGCCIRYGVALQQSTHARRVVRATRKRAWSPTAGCP